MAITAATFRESRPEFADVVAYPDASITYWATVGGLLLRADRWGDGATTPISPPSTLYDIGLELFVAHNLVLDHQAQNVAATGGVPGQTQGPVASKSVAGVSVSYDTGSGIEANAGHWNLTRYGVQLKRMIDMVGAGPISIFGSTYGSLGGVGWPGPITASGQNW